MLLHKNKKNQLVVKGGSPNRFLISITVIGSAGPIRFVVNEEDLVAAVVATALKAYAREGRLPVLGSDVNDFVLYCPASGHEGLSALDKIGSFGIRNFMLCKKPQKDRSLIGDGKQIICTRGTNHSWKNWFNKSPKIKISSH